MTIPLINGIPQLGLGTYPLRDAECVSAVRMAIDLGITHIDTAQMYGNEAEVGWAVADVRDRVFVVTKVDPSNLSRSRFLKSVEGSVRDLRGPADLLLIHWPPADPDLPAMIDCLVEAKEKGHAKRIGVSNFSPSRMKLAQSRTGGAIVNNQVEFHPLIDQSGVMATAKEQGIAVSAYSPLARGKALSPDVVQAVARKHARPASEIVLRWILQQGVIAIPMTTKKENAASNLRALEFELSADDMAALSALGNRSGKIVAPSWMADRWD